MTRSRRGGRRTRRRNMRAAAPPATTSEAGGDGVLSGWARLSRGTRAFVALVATTAVAAIVPGVIPYLSDRAMDLLRMPVVDVDTTFGAAEGLYLAAAETVSAQPTDPMHDPRFVPAGHSAAKLTLVGRRAGGVAVTDVTVEIVERKPLRTGTYYGIPPQGETDNTALAINLDAPAPKAVAADGGAPYFVTKHINLARGELWLIHVDSRAVRHEYAWRLHLKLRYRGAQREIVVPPADRSPFRMTAFAAKPEDYAMQYTWGQAGPIVRRDCATERAACAAEKLGPTARRR